MLSRFILCDEDHEFDESIDHFKEPDEAERIRREKRHNRINNLMKQVEFSK